MIDIRTAEELISIRLAQRWLAEERKVELPRVEGGYKALRRFLIETIEDQIENNPILFYMKGSPNQPQCGFSARTVQALMACGERFAYVDILANPEIRANLPKYANWPTFPQLWVDGELIGGCDIVTEMHESGELQTLIKESAAAREEGAEQ